MNKALHSTAVLTCQTILMVTVLCFICFTHTHTASAQDSDIMIDGYELPDMFDDDASAPIQNHSSGVPEEKIITPPKTKVHKETQLPAPADNYESAFKPLQTVTSTKQETVSIPYPQPRPTQLAVRETINENITKELIALSVTTMSALADIPKPFKRPLTIVQKSSKARATSSLPKDPIMPAVPAGDVEVVMLAQPEMHFENTQDQNNITDISIQMDVEDGNATDIINVSAEEDINESAQGSNKENIDLPVITFLFNQGYTALNDEVKKRLNDDVIDALKSYPDMRIEIKSFAEPIDDSPSSARRTSLARALAIRDHILNHNIASHRMDLRALGQQTNKLPIDRIEIILLP
ncbi:MAG: OmpA family protein [Alphaproteobacteria bacterium]